MIWDSGLWDETLGVASKAVAAQDTEIVLDSAYSYILPKLLLLLLRLISLWLFGLPKPETLTG